MDAITALDAITHAGRVSSDQAAEILNVKVRTLRWYLNWIEDFPKPERIRNRLAFDPDELLAWRAHHPSK